MQFATKIPISKSNQPIDYNSKIVSLGSCFAVNMAEQFNYYKFQDNVNPFGIIFNSVSIEKIVKRIIQQDFFTDKDIFFHNERWHCFEVHSDLSYPNKEIFLEKLNQILKITFQQLKEATHIIVTYGTAWVYRNLATTEIVANCHKISQKEFTKELLSVDIIQQSIQNTIDLIQQINPKVNFIFTISPVRHIKDGFVENQQSKAHLIAALHQIFDVKFLTLNYFPSYEIMMDELRDYRFYAEDMLHPNLTAIRYIWSHFKESYISENSFEIMEEVATIQKSLQHKPFNPNSISHLQFEAKLREKITKLSSKYSHIQF